MRRSPAEAGFLSAVGIAVLVFLVFPQIVVTLASFDPGEFFQFPPDSFSPVYYRQLIIDEEWRSSIAYSFVIAACTSVTAMIVGSLAGIAVARLPKRIRAPFYLLLAVPLVIPTILVAISFYGVALQLHLTGSLLVFVLVDTMVTSPLVALLVVGAALSGDPNLEFASLSLGASRWRTLWNITVPVIAPTATVGGILAFLHALDEVVMSSFLVAPGAVPLAVRMFLELEFSTPPIVLAASTLLIATSIVIIGVLVVLNQLVASRRGTVVIQGLDSGSRSGDRSAESAT